MDWRNTQVFFGFSHLGPLIFSQVDSQPEEEEKLSSKVVSRIHFYYNDKLSTPSKLSSLTSAKKGCSYPLWSCVVHPFALGHLVMMMMKIDRQYNAEHILWHNFQSQLKKVICPNTIWWHLRERFPSGASQESTIGSSSTESRAQRVGVFNFGTDRVRVLEKIFRDGSGMDRVRVFASYI